MKIRRGKKNSGVRQEVLDRLHGLEVRFETLEHDVGVLSMAERLKEACRRISELEAERSHARVA